MPLMVYCTTAVTREYGSDKQELEERIDPMIKQYGADTLRLPDGDGPTYASRLEQDVVRHSS